MISAEQIYEVASIVATFPRLTRTELANTICEIYAWKRPTGKLKTVECRQFLERLDAKGIVKLPPCKLKYARRFESAIQRSDRTRFRSIVSSQLKELLPITLHRVEGVDQRRLWSEYMDRYHYLGYRIPFGAQLKYFIQARLDQARLGCLQFSSPAWRMAARDRWIGWSDNQRKQNLQRIICNSRFLIFPWVQVKNLASTVLAMAANTVPGDWCECYGCQPLLMETLVDRTRYLGTCYRAANWVLVGQTSGRGRMDRKNQRQGAAVKDIYLYPLSKTFRQTLIGD
jgi:hypothetical protein